MTMLEFPAIQEIVYETLHKSILAVVNARLGPVPADLEAELKAVTDIDKLDELVKVVAVCPDLASFRTKLHAL